MDGLVANLIPYQVRLKVRGFLYSILGESVSKGYDNYAKKFKANSGKYLGDEWNEPEVIGFDVPPTQIVSMLDQMIFTPFLGNPESILEIGSGGGRFTEVLIPKCRKLIATDTSPNMMSLLRERFKTCSNLEYVVLDGKGLGPIPSKSVNAVFSYDVFNHLEQWDIYNYLTEIKRVLKPGGAAIVHYSNSFSELGWKRFLDDIPLQLNVPKVWGTLSFMTPEIFIEFISRAGLEHVETITNVVRRDAISLVRAPNSNAR
jgi:ubiquinone/menaquinone biosynthesis C-methylase UbiE